MWHLAHENLIALWAQPDTKRSLALFAGFVAYCLLLLWAEWRTKRTEAAKRHKRAVQERLEQFRRLLPEEEWK